MLGNTPVTPGYHKQPDLTAQMFDEEGFYKIGDAGRFVDPDDPSWGLVFETWYVKADGCPTGPQFGH